MTKQPEKKKHYDRDPLMVKYYAQKKGFSHFSMYPSLQQTHTQPFEMNAMSRSGLPTITSPVMRPTALGLSAFRGPRMRSAFNPAPMAFSRQLSSITGISLPMSAQPGMGIVGGFTRMN